MLKKFGDRVKRGARALWVIGGRSVPGVLGLVAVLISGFAGEVTSAVEEVSVLLGRDWGWITSPVSDWSVRLVGWLGTAGAVYARVMRVPASVRGWEPVGRLLVAYRGPDGAVREVTE